MSLNNLYWGGRGQCPICGRFCGQITPYGNESRGLWKVTGVCKHHGEVDLTKQEWAADDFFSDEEAQ